MRRLIFLAAAIALAWLAGQDAALAGWRSSLSLERAADTSLAVPSWWADDPLLRLRAGARLVPGSPALAAQAPAIGAAARAVLRRAPLDALALRQLGAIAGDSGSAQDFFTLAEQVSRRDLPTELAAINRTALAGDSTATIRHYHHALATFPAAKAQLLPTLASQLTEPDVRKALLAYADQPWLRDLVINPVEYDAPPAATMEFYRMLAGRVPIGELQQGTMAIVRWLAAYDQYAALGAYVRQLPAVDTGQLAAIGINATTSEASLAPLSWTLVNDAAVESQVVGSGLSISIESGLSAVAASRLTLLAPGEYMFTVKLSYPAAEPHAQLAWKVTCPQAPLAPLLQMAMDARGEGGAMVQSGRLVIPAGCDAQSWQLRASADSAQLASSVRVSEITLTRR